MNEDLKSRLRVLRHRRERAIERDDDERIIQKLDARIDLYDDIERHRKNDAELLKAMLDAEKTFDSIIEHDMAQLDEIGVIIEMLKGNRSILAS